MRHLVLLGLLVTLPLAIGCSAGGPLSDLGPSSDSLRAENAALRAQLRQARDSLQFRLDIETGQYYRDLRQLEDQVNRLTYEARTLRDGGLTVRRLPADSLFEPGTATLSPAGTERLRSVAARLETTYPNRPVRIEGHADPTPLGPGMQERFASNWELSAARATTVVRHLIDQSSLDPNQFAAVAFGDTDPVASNESAAGRRRNRRVRIAVLPAPRDYSRPFETAW